MLYLDTAHDVGYVSLAEELYLMEGRRHSETAGPLLERLWHTGIEGIAVGVGPGSYTGLRIGMALAQGLHLASGTALLSYCSLEAYWEPGSISLFDARAGGVYCWDGKQAFRASIEELGVMESPLISPDAERVEERLKEAGYDRAVKQGLIDVGRIQPQPVSGLPAPLYLKSL